MMKKLHGYISITDHCNAACSMCSIGKNGNSAVHHIDPTILEKLPTLFYCDITGGEPFLHPEIGTIISILSAKSKRLLIITNGILTEKIVTIAQKHKNVAFRISLDGSEKTHNAIRGIDNCHQAAHTTLQELKTLGIKDLGVCTTIQEQNSDDLLPLYEFCKQNSLDFSTALPHSSFYFGAQKELKSKEKIQCALQTLVEELLRSKQYKDWFRAYFNNGLIQYLHNNPRILPCHCGTESFLLLPDASVTACNGSAQPISFGSLANSSWNDVWNSPQADSIRNSIKTCRHNCWMMCNVAPAIWNAPLKPIWWVVKKKLGIGQL